MRKLLISLCLAVSVAACATVPASQPTGPTTGPIDPRDIAQIQQIATTVCGFLPTAATVAGIITTFTGGGEAIAPVQAVATAICNAVVPSARGARRGAARPKVRGVAIRGRFVR